MGVVSKKATEERRTLRKAARKMRKLANKQTKLYQKCISMSGMRGSSNHLRDSEIEQEGEDGLCNTCFYVIRKIAVMYEEESKRTKHSVDQHVRRVRESGNGLRRPEGQEQSVRD